MMTQKHIGYTTWNDNFPRDIMPRVERISVAADAENALSEGGKTFVADRGRVSIEAEHYYKIQQPATGKGAWTVIPDMGRTKGSLAVMPYIEPLDGASVSYRFVIPASEKPTTSSVNLTLMLKSNLAFANVDGHRYGIRVNGGEERIVNYNGNLNEKPENIYSVYYPTVARRVIVSSLNIPADVFTNAPADTYELVIRPLEPGLVIQKVVLMLDGSTPKAYLGYPESPQKR
jgi:hypothetical protein